MQRGQRTARAHLNHPRQNTRHSVLFALYGVRGGAVALTLLVPCVVRRHGRRLHLHHARMPARIIGGALAVLR